MAYTLDHNNDLNWKTRVLNYVFSSFSKSEMPGFELGLPDPEAGEIPMNHLTSPTLIGHFHS